MNLGNNLFQVIVCTLTTAGRLSQGRIAPKHFSHIFIDEAGSATESQTLIAVAGKYNQHLCDIKTRSLCDHENQLYHGKCLICLRSLYDTKSNPCQSDFCW